MRDIFIEVSAFIVAMIVVIVPVYLLLSLVHMSFNIADWHTVSRLVLGVWGGYCFYEGLFRGVDSALKEE